MTMHFTHQIRITTQVRSLFIFKGNSQLFVRSKRKMKCILTIVWLNLTPLLFKLIVKGELVNMVCPNPMDEAETWIVLDGSKDGVELWAEGNDVWNVFDRSKGVELCPEWNNPNAEDCCWSELFLKPHVEHVCEDEVVGKQFPEDDATISQNICYPRWFVPTIWNSLKQLYKIFLRIVKDNCNCLLSIADSITRNNQRWY